MKIPGHSCSIIGIGKYRKILNKYRFLKLHIFTDLF